MSSPALASPTAAPHTRPLSVIELQAALHAAWRGQFADPHPDPRSVRAAGHDAAWPSTLRDDGATAAAPADSASGLAMAYLSLQPRPVLLIGAQPQAGCSTVALALGDALDEALVPARLLECADPLRSGLAAVSHTELGADTSGWRRGRRGRLIVDRLGARPAAPDRLPPPRPVPDTPRPDMPVSDTAHSGSLVLLDLGPWPHAGTGWRSDLLADSDLVVVCRATVPGLRAAEHLLSTITGSPGANSTASPCRVVAAVGPKRWPKLLRTQCGPQLRAAATEARIVTVPAHRQLALTGPTAEPLPSPVALAGRRLAERLLLTIPTARQPVNPHPAPAPTTAQPTQPQLPGLFGDLDAPTDEGALLW